MHMQNHSQPSPVIRKPSRSGFTLVEMLVVIGIISVLAAILFPVVNRVKQGGQRTVCLNNMKQMGLAFQQYLTDHDSRYPGAGQLQKWGNGGHWIKGTNNNALFKLAPPEEPTGNSADVQGGALYPYVKNAKIYICPSSPYGEDITNVSYSMNCAIAGMSNRSRMKNPSEIILLVDEAYANDGFFFIDNPTAPAVSTSTDALAQFHLNSGNLLFSDGHVRSYTYNQFPLSKDSIDIKRRKTEVPRFWDLAFGTQGYYDAATGPPTNTPAAFGTCVLP